MSEKEINILGYKIISLKEMITQLDEERVNQILSSFSSPMNKDVESFLKHSAIILDKQSVSRTHLVFTSYRNRLVLVGYFTLAYKDFTIPAKNISSKLKKRIAKFGTYDINTRTYRISAPLIAQLSKNFTNQYNKLITGDELLKMACNLVSEIHMLAGGKIVYIECEDKPKLREFYESNGFVVFNNRQLDGKSRENMDSDYLLQLLRYL
ncbi:MAG: N-acetyltransferase [Acutalibacteraceae bacterium]